MDIETLREKWLDVLECADDYTEKNLVSEFLEDLEHLNG